jgi:hypothetical protein
MYEHNPEDVDVLGWEEFVLRQWESIFLGYRSNIGLRAVGRRWCDLLEVGIGCSQDVADELVRAELFDGVDRDLEGARNPTELLARMADVLNDMKPLLSELPGLPPEDTSRLLDQHQVLTDLLIS